MKINLITFLWGALSLFSFLTGSFFMRFIIRRSKKQRFGCGRIATLVELYKDNAESMKGRTDDE